jgi:hypothetical protein
MKRGLRTATGILALLATVLFLGMNFTALADGVQGPPSGNDAVSPVRAPQRDVVRHLPVDSPELTSSKDTKITKSTTVTNKTYNSNVWVYAGVTLTVGKNGNVVVNGDLNIGGIVRMSSGKLTVNGDIWVYGRLELSGTAKVKIGRAHV